jgi:hypothetical protein
MSISPLLLLGYFSLSCLQFQAVGVTVTASLVSLYELSMVLGRI